MWHKWYVWVSQLFGPEFDSYVMCMKKHLMKNVSTLDKFQLSRGNKSMQLRMKNTFGFIKNNINIDRLPKMYCHYLDFSNLVCGNSQ